MGSTTAKEAWTTLQEEFEGSEKVRAVKLQTLRRNFELLNMKESKTVNDYYSKIKEIVNQMRAYGENILDKKIVEKILISVPYKYDPIIVTWRAKNLLELIHTDICGPMRTSSLHNNRYFILFIDDFSRMTWVYFIKEKSEVFGILKKFKTLVEKQSGKQIKVLRSDRGKEYTSHEFDKFCEDEGIEQKLTVSYSPQQNGVSERKNRTVMEMARSMLKEKGLPNTFWAEVVYTAVYILNRCPTRTVQDKTLIEAWSGKKPSTKHLRVFGSICYIHVLEEKRHKLEDKIVRGIFLGYSIQSKGYRVYNLQTKKLIISRDVEVDENVTCNWNDEKVEKNIPISIQQPEEETTKVSSEPHSPPQQQTPSPESTPRRVRSLADIYETCNLATLEPERFEATSKQQV
uniref:Retrovirus-related Pol polyprotein from transposon TNT 1-94 n=1 Tax=Cajanus cajan TaxID=3821 RepID=A0A151TPH7_CAJCA|nr:Retrovirus-related Pol polyprotein from transposon TNT 1-94 [Cajanus cajan]